MAEELSELSEQIKAVEADIAKVVLDIGEAEAELKLVVAKLASRAETAELPADLRAERERLNKKLEQLRTKEEQLRTEKEQLRTEKELLLRASLPRGAARWFSRMAISAGPCTASLLAAEPAADAKAAGFAAEYAKPRSDFVWRMAVYHPPEGTLRR